MVQVDHLHPHLDFFQHQILLVKDLLFQVQQLEMYVFLNEFKKKLYIFFLSGFQQVRGNLKNTEVWELEN